MSRTLPANDGGSRERVPLTRNEPYQGNPSEVLAAFGADLAQHSDATNLDTRWLAEMLGVEWDTLATFCATGNGLAPEQVRSLLQVMQAQRETIALPVVNALDALSATSAGDLPRLRQRQYDMFGEWRDHVGTHLRRHTLTTADLARHANLPTTRISEALDSETSAPISRTLDGINTALGVPQQTRRRIRVLARQHEMARRNGATDRPAPTIVGLAADLTLREFGERIEVALGDDLRTSTWLCEVTGVQRDQLDRINYGYQVPSGVIEQVIALLVPDQLDQERARAANVAASGGGPDSRVTARDIVRPLQTPAPVITPTYIAHLPDFLADLHNTGLSPSSIASQIQARTSVVRELLAGDLDQVEVAVLIADTFGLPDYVTAQLRKVMTARRLPSTVWPSEEGRLLRKHQAITVATTNLPLELMTDEQFSRYRDRFDTKAHEVLAKRRSRRQAELANHPRAIYLSPQLAAEVVTPPPVVRQLTTNQLGRPGELAPDFDACGTTLLVPRHPTVVKLPLPNEVSRHVNATLAAS